MRFADWLAQQTRPAHPGANAQNLVLVFDDDSLPCGCTTRDPERVRCYCETRHLEDRQVWLRRRDELFTDLGPEPVAGKWHCSCHEPEDRPGMRHQVRHIVVHPDGKVWHWGCGKQIGQITTPTGPVGCVGG